MKVEDDAVETLLMLGTHFNFEEQKHTENTILFRHFDEKYAPFKFLSNFSKIEQVPGA